MAELGGQTTTYSYDGELLASQASSGEVSGSVAWGYDANFWVTSEQIADELPTAFEYDRDGLITAAGAETLSRDPAHGFVTATALGTVSDAWSYSTFGELDEYAAEAGTISLYSTAFERDDLGRITKVTEVVDGDAQTLEYRYHRRGWLEAVLRDGSRIATYSYDSNGNRTELALASDTIVATFDAQDRLESQGDTTFVYAPNGQLETKQSPTGTTRYTYDALGNLLGVQLPGGRTIEYIVDPLGRRVGKKLDGALTQGFPYRDALRPVAELDEQGSVATVFVYASKANVPDQMLRGSVTYRIISDWLGSPRLVVNASTGEIAQRLDYDVWGNVVADTNPGFQPFGFAGGLYDPETKLVRFGARDYDAESGRWTAKDPTLFAGEQANLYQYAHSDPINWIDPTGEVPWGLLLAGADVGLQLYLNEGQLGCVDWTSVGLSLVGGGMINAIGKGALRINRGRHTWDATRKWMNRQGIQRLARGQHRHHWLFERNQGIGQYVPDAIKNQPWNTNPISAGFNNWLGRHPGLAWVGGPSWAAEVGGGSAVIVGSE